MKFTNIFDKNFRKDTKFELKKQIFEKNSHKLPPANNLTPFVPTHPGSIIRDELEERNLTQSKLANIQRIAAML